MKIFTVTNLLRMLLPAALAVGTVGLSGCGDDNGANSGGGGSGSFTYNGQTYKTVKIGGETWMAENLNVETADSWCYENSADSCNKYGRLYTWSAALTACPAGWHLPTREEWGELAKAAGGTGDYGIDGTAGRALMSRSGWYGKDAYGFSALPGGHRYPLGAFLEVGEYGRWWTATEYGDGSAYGRAMRFGYVNVNEGHGDKRYGFSVRCRED